MRRAILMLCGALPLIAAGLIVNMKVWAGGALVAPGVGVMTLFRTWDPPACKQCVG